MVVMMAGGIQHGDHREDPPDDRHHALDPLRVGEPDYLVSNFVHGVKHLPCTIG